MISLVGYVTDKTGLYSRSKARVKVAMLFK